MEKILVLVAHADDMELSCGGTVLKNLVAGNIVNVAIMTKGGYGDRPYSVITEEMAASEKCLGITFLQFQNSILNLTANEKTINEVDHIVDLFSYNTIITQHYGDSHQDHRAVYEIGLAVSRAKCVKKLLLMENPIYANKRMAPFNANYFVDITELVTEKKKLMSVYNTYVDADMSDSVITLNRMRAMCNRSNDSYYEAFECVFYYE